VDNDGVSPSSPRRGYAHNPGFDRLVRSGSYQHQTNRGAIQREILDETELTFYGQRAASFAFLVASAPRDRLFESDLVKRSLSELTTLIDAASSGTLEETLGRLHPRALSKYRDLLEQLDDLESGLTAIVSPRQDKGRDRP